MKLRYLISLFALVAVVSIALVQPGMALQQTLTLPPATETATLQPTAIRDGQVVTEPAPVTLEPTATQLPPPTATQPPPAEELVVPLEVNGPPGLGYGPEDYPAGVNPLTGLAVDDPALLERRPLVIKVTNYPRSVRPQWGLSRADLVYEYYMEWGITRFITVFYGQDAAKVGPVRSGRFFDEHIFRMYDGFFVFGSADRRVLDYFLSLGDHVVNSFILAQDEDNKRACRPGLVTHLCREVDLETYNNLFTNTAGLTRFVSRERSNYRPDLRGMHFSDWTAPSDQLGLEVGVHYSGFIYSEWRYSEELGRYLRYQETIGSTSPYGSGTEVQPLTDALTGEQLSAANVVVLVVPHEFFVKTKSTEIVDINLEGAGLAYVFRDGFAYPAIWQRPDGRVLTLLDGNGGYFPLKPGNTWFQVISEESVVASTGPQWRFQFNLPPEVTVTPTPEE